MTVFLDFETRSLCDLKVTGGYNYCRDKTTEVLCACAILDEVEYVWCPFVDVELPDSTVSREMPPEILAAAEAGATFVAHNANGFDRWLWEAKGYPPVQWLDTLELCRSNSLPGRLDAVSNYLWNEGKDEGGNTMLRLSKPGRNGRFLPVNRQNGTVVSRYCAKDVRLMKRLYPLLDNQEPELLRVNDAINSRGFCFDVELAQRLVACDAINRQAAIDNCPVDGELLRSNKQLLEWLGEFEVALPNLQRRTILEYLEDEAVAEPVRKVLEARIGATRITSAKVTRALGLVAPDGRIRNGYAFHGAQTGRWASRGLNVANLPRGIKCDIDNLVAETMAGYQPTDDELSTLIRACITGPLTVVDFSQIEVRVLAWLAGQESLLDTFRNGGDVYRELACRIFATDSCTGDMRQVGKALVLGCGFGLGAKTFAIYGKGYGIDFDAIGWSPQQLVDAYRDSYPLIAGADTHETYKGHKIRKGGLWKAQGKAFWRVAACESSEEFAGRCRFTRQGDDVLTYLPSGRYLRYRKVTIEDRIPSWGGDPRPTILYQNPRGYRSTLFNSKIVQNNTQAVARDLLANALINLEKRLYRTVLHCYDEVAVETEDFGGVKECCLDIPSWAEGLPVDADGDVVSRYRKV